jgi:hypothetical protein
VAGRDTRAAVPIHPILFAAYPILALLGYNIEEIRAGAALRPLAVSLFATAVLFLLLRLALHSAQKAAFITTLLLVLFFFYGHAYNFLETKSLLGVTLGRHRLLVVVWIGLLGLGLWWALRKARDFQGITPVLNSIGAALLIFPLLQLGMFELRSVQAASEPQDTSPYPAFQLPAGRPAPDIYYIILDAYTRQDMLDKFYQLDNRPFLDRLSRMGFYVARCSQSNYSQTQLSLASSLNSDYLDALGSQFKPGSASRVGLANLIQHSATRQALESLGYTTVAFETGFESTQLEDANPYLSPAAIPGVTEFETLLLRTTAGRLLSEGISFLHLRPDWEARDQAQRQRILFTLEELRALPDMPGPKFVFAHIVSPHWPHVFGPNGESVHEKPDSVSGYRNQVIFLNKQIIPILQEILAKSHTPPIIILQGDHGSVIESPERRMAILNAYYLPEEGKQALYASISPVNTFRVIFNAVFGDSRPLLADRAFYSSYELPYNYQVIPNDKSACN